MKNIYENEVIWIGTAEVNHKLKGEVANDSLRVRVALVKSPKRGDEQVLVEWEGTWITENQTVFSREYEDAASGDLIETVNPEIAKRIDAALARKRK
jgi:hypothetical protein